MQGGMRAAGAALWLAGVTAAVGAAQALDVRPGEWEYTVTLQGTEADLPPSVPPAARAGLLAMWAKPRVVRDCLTAKAIADASLGADSEDEPDCKTVKRSVTATTAEMTRSCTGDEPRTEVVRVQTDGRERFRMEATRSAGHGPAKVTMVAKWVGPTCRD